MLVADAELELVWAAFTAVIAFCIGPSLPLSATLNTHLSIHLAHFRRPPTIPAIHSNRVELIAHAKRTAFLLFYPFLEARGVVAVTAEREKVAGSLKADRAGLLWVNEVWEVLVQAVVIQVYG